MRWKKEREEKRAGRRETVDNCKKLSQSEIKNAKTNRQRDSDKRRSCKPGESRRAESGERLL